MKQFWRFPLNRPTVSLALIAKNEAHNIGPLLSSVRGCFDEIVFVDTGSTDNTLDFVDQINKQIDAGASNWDGIPHVQVYHFDWINDFAAARNFAFSKATKDYICWLDLDDSLSSADEFIKWRDTVMHAAHYWIATYNYAFNAKGEVECQFVRERVIKRNHGFAWEYPVHEGIIQKEGKKFWTQKANTWWVNHRRTDEDRKQDHMRNVKIIEKLDLETMHPRMKFYYGKELYENGMPVEAGKPLLEAAKSQDLDIHDRILTIQYAAQSAIAAKKYAEAVDLLYNGLKLMPTRAEYWCLIGDAYLCMQKVGEAVQAFEFALKCQPNNLGGIVVIYGASYSELPHMKLAAIYLDSGMVEKAQPHIDALEALKHPSVDGLKARAKHVLELGQMRTDLPKTEDVIITCHAGMPGNWDEVTLEAKGHGGSETAAIEVAKWIKKKTNRRVKIFQTRASRDVMPSGVEYVPVHELHGYLSNIEPKAHIAWRHTGRLTKAKSYLWCHDLVLPGIAQTDCDKIVALSEFHKNYLVQTAGVDEKKIVLGFNGINPDDFKQTAEKNPLKVVYSSSPDRGLEQCIDIVKRARELSGLNITLHTFYGFEGMYKNGLGEWADKIKAKIKDNSDFVTHHGLVNKKELVHHFMEAAVWLYPADFIETFCITALEALSAKAWPVVRAMGALPYTLQPALDAKCCDMLDIEVKDDASIGLWANTVVDAILNRKWEQMHFEPEHFSWEKVADFYIKELGL